MTTYTLDQEPSAFMPSLDEHDTPLLTIRQFCDHYEWPSETALRSYVQRADELGLAKAFIKLGRRVLVDPTLFFSLVRAMNGVVRSKTPLREEKYASAHKYRR